MSFPEYASEDSFVWIARDLPNPRHYAEGLLMRRRDLARELLAARKTGTGWKFKYDPDGSLIGELRALGLCDVSGRESSVGHSGPGWHVTPFGLVVRNRLLQILATRELESPMENEERAD